MLFFIEEIKNCFENNSTKDHPASLVLKCNILLNVWNSIFVFSMKNLKINNQLFEIYTACQNCQYTFEFVFIGKKGVKLAHSIDLKQ